MKHNFNHKTKMEKKYQSPQNYKQRFKTNKSNKKIKIKIKTTILVITHITKSTNRIKEQKRKKKIVSFIHKPP